MLSEISDIIRRYQTLSEIPETLSDLWLPSITELIRSKAQAHSESSQTCKMELCKKAKYVSEKRF